MRKETEGSGREMRRRESRNNKARNNLAVNTIGTEPNTTLAYDLG